MIPTEKGFYFVKTNDSRDDGLCLVLFNSSAPKKSEVWLFGEEEPGRTLAYYLDDIKAVTWSERIKSPEEGRFLRFFDDYDLLTSATRYYIGRKTISVSYFARQLAKAWDEIPENVREIIKNDLERAFESDDQDREEGRDFYTLGQDCDRRSWELVRACYKDTISERAQRGRSYANSGGKTPSEAAREIVDSNNDE